MTLRSVASREASRRYFCSSPFAPELSARVLCPNSKGSDSVRSCECINPAGWKSRREMLIEEAEEEMQSEEEPPAKRQG